MRAARLLQILLLLQNRGRQTSAQLAEELEVVPRTILRDVDAMTEAGLPIIVHQGNQGGIELGFNYRTRLTGLTEDEAKALGLILTATNPMIEALGLGTASAQARAKLIESLPDRTRKHVSDITRRFTHITHTEQQDPRIQALAMSVQSRRVVRLRFTAETEQVIHPTGMQLQAETWRVRDDISNAWIADPDWGRVNISARKFLPTGP